MKHIARLQHSVIAAAVIICFLLFIALRFAASIDAEAGRSVSALNPITVTKTSVLSPVGDGVADPGETIQHTIVIGNGGTIATNVQLTDTLQSITNWGGAVAVSPIAVNDTYNAIGNVSISVPDGALDLLGNDTNPGGAGSLAITVAPALSVNGGNVNVNATTGAFTYNPAPGFNGVDTFSYTLGNGSGLTDTATVTINVSTPIWFVRAGAPGGGDGRIGTPFNCFVGAGCFSGTTADEAGDAVFFYSGTYTGGQTMLNNQRILGQNAGTTLAAFMGVTPESYSATLPATGGAFARPVVTTAAAGTNGLNLGSDNTLRGFNIGDTTGVDISGTAFGTVAISEMALTGTGRPLNLTNGTVAITLDSITATSAAGGNGIGLTTVAGTLTVAGTTSVTGSSADGINITGSSVVVNFGTSTTASGSAGDNIEVSTSTGNVTFGNTSTTGGTNGILLNANTGGTRSFGTISTTNGTAAAFAHQAAGGNVSISGNATLTNPGTNCINIQDSTSSITFINVACTQSGGTGVYLDDNTGAMTFSDLDISPDGGQRGFEADPGITGTISTSSGSITTSTGIPVDIEGTSAGSRTPLNMTLTLVSCNGAANGIILTNVNGPGVSTGFSVIGDGTSTTVGGNATGGVIQNTVGVDDDSPADAGGVGVRLVNADEVSLRRMTLTTHANFGIYGEGSSNFTFEYSRVNGTNGTATGINNPTNSDASVAFNNLSTAALFKDAILEGGLEDNVRVINTGTTVLNRIVFNNVTIGLMDLGNASGDNGILLQARNTSTMNVTIQDSDITHARGDMLQLDLTDTATSDLIFDNNTVHNQHPNVVVGGGGVTISGGGSAGAAPTLTYEFDNNSFRGARGSGLLIIFQTGAGSASGRIDGNTFGFVPSPVTDLDQNASAREAAAIELRTEGRAAQTFLVNNNQIRRYGQNGIYIEFDGINTAGSTGTIGQLNGTVTNNTIEAPRTTVGNKIGVHLNFGATSGDNYQGCLDVLNNAGENAGSPDTGAANRDYVVRQRMLTTLRLPSYAGGSTDVAAVQSYVQVRNTGAETVFAATPSGGGGYIGGANCTQPPAFSERGVIRSHDEDLTRLESSHTDVMIGRWTMSTRATVPETEVNIVKTQFNAKDSASGVTLSKLETAFKTVPVFISELSDRLSRSLAPMAYAQQQTAPEGVGDVNLGPFTIPANESVTVRFNVTVNNGPYASGINAITNTAAVTADGGVNVNSNTTSINLNAAPDLQVTVSDGNTTTQPGAVILYTTTYQNNTATNGQNAAAVRISQTVPIGTTFNAANSTGTWSCADGSPAGTSCTVDVGAVNAGDAPGNRVFAVNVPALLAAGVVNIGDTATIAENPSNANGNDRVPANNSSSDTTNVVGNWDGSNSADWNLAANWSNDVIPPAGNSISIPLAGNQPQVTTSDVTVNLLSLGRNLTINSGRTVSATGNVALGANVIDGAGTLSLGPASQISRTSGQINATLRKNFAGPGPAFEMPVGTAGVYSPLTVTVTNGAGQLTARANTGMPAVTPQPLDAARTLQRFWTLSGSGIRSNLTFQYRDGDVPATPGTEALWHVIRVTNLSAVRYAPSADVIVNAAANTYTVNNLESYSDWTAGEPLAPTAANAGVSGRVVDADGRGVFGAQVSMQDAEGNVRWATTNPFGYYRFIGVPAGQSYIVAPRHKRFAFQARTVTVSDDLVDVNFVAEQP